MSSSKVGSMTRPAVVTIIKDLLGGASNASPFPPGFQPSQTFGPSPSIGNTAPTTTGSPVQDSTSPAEAPSTGAGGNTPATP